MCVLLLASAIIASIELDGRSLSTETQKFPANTLIITTKGRSWRLVVPVNGDEFFEIVASLLNRDTLRFHVEPYNGYVHEIRRDQAWPETITDRRVPTLVFRE